MTIRNSILITALILCMFSSANAGINDLNSYELYFKYGDGVIDGCDFKTYDNGQYYFKNSNIELRLKQNSSISVTNNPLALTDEFIFNKGVIGLKVASDTVLVKTPYGEVRARNSTIVLKNSEDLIRICVIKGNVTIKKKTNFISLPAGKEIAISHNQVSKPYKYLDDLRYTWYWVEPAREPAFRDE